MIPYFLGYKEAANTLSLMRYANKMGFGSQMNVVNKLSGGRTGRALIDVSKDQEMITGARNMLRTNEEYIVSAKNQLKRLNSFIKSTGGRPAHISQNKMQRVKELRDKLIYNEALVSGRRASRKDRITVENMLADLNLRNRARVLHQRSFNPSQPTLTRRPLLGLTGPQSEFLRM